MSVISAVVFTPAPLATSTSARASSSRVLAAGHERAGAGLDVEHERVEALGELLGEDRRDDQRDRLDGAGGVARRVEAAVGGCEVGGLADDRAADVAHHALDHLGRGRRRVAGDRVELVQRPAGVAEAAAADHRHRDAAGGEDRREHQAHLVPHAAGRVLVDHGLVEVPVQDAAAVAHRRGQREPLLGVEAFEEERHRQRADLRVADSPPSVIPPTRKAISSRAECRSVALLPDDLRCEQLVLLRESFGRAARGRAPRLPRCAGSARARAPRRPCPRRGS